MMYNKLTSEEKQIIEGRATEVPFAGKYDDFYREGTFVCRKCNNPLFSSKAKFHAGCGWPSFSESFKNSISRKMDPDGQRIEIKCFNCGAHLGHVFTGEHLNDKDTRYCTNSLSLRFISKSRKIPKILYE